MVHILEIELFYSVVWDSFRHCFLVWHSFRHRFFVWDGFWHRFVWHRFRHCFLLWQSFVHRFLVWHSFSTASLCGTASCTASSIGTAPGTASLYGTASGTTYLRCSVPYNFIIKRKMHDWLQYMAINYIPRQADYGNDLNGVFYWAPNSGS